MNWKTLKEDELKAFTNIDDGIVISEVEMGLYNNCKMVQFTAVDDRGEYVFVRVRSDTSLAVAIPQPPNKVTKYLLKGKLGGCLSIDREYHNTREGAENRRKEIVEKFCPGADAAESGLSVTEVEVEE